VLTMSWLDGRKPRDLTAEERLLLVSRAAPCLALQLMDSGFVHCDPHEGNMMLLDDGRLGLIDFGLVAQMTAVHQESMASAILNLLTKDYKALVPCFRGMGILSSDSSNDDDLRRPGEDQSFADALEEALSGGGGRERLVQAKEGDGLDRRRAFGQLYEELSGLAFRYYFSLPSYYILVMRSFVTLEGIAFGADPDFNMYTTTYPFALRRILTPRTHEGKALLRKVLLLKEEEASAGGPRLRLMALLEERGPARSVRQNKDGQAMRGVFTTAARTTAEVLAAPEGRELRRVFASLDGGHLAEDLASPAACPLRQALAEALAQRLRRSPPSSPQSRSSRRISRLLLRLGLRHVRSAARKRPLLVAALSLRFAAAVVLRLFRRRPAPDGAVSES
ncbi:unnamed protein product, partial [Polarella glacialis]